MSIDLSAAIEAAGRVTLESAYPSLSWDNQSSLARHVWSESVLPIVAAAAPLIEAAVREQVAAEIDDYEPSSLAVRLRADWKDALEWAAAIARGQS